MKVQCGAAMRSSDITRCNYDTALCSALWRLKVFNAYDVRKCLEIAMNKNSLAFKSLCALKAANKKLNLGVVRTVAACE